MKYTTKDIKPETDDCISVEQSRNEEMDQLGNVQIWHVPQVFLTPTKISDLQISFK